MSMYQQPPHSWRPHRRKGHQLYRQGESLRPRALVPRIGG